MRSRLATPSATRAVLEEFGLATKHRLGQNFLVNDAIIEKICDLAELGPDDVVLEVGPGIGTLTVAMLEACSAVVSLEADHELEQVLASTCARDSEKFALLMGDALRVAPEDVADAVASLGKVPAAAMPNKFVSNLPYQVAATLILKFMQQMPSIRSTVVMVQAEVADRIAATPGSRDFGAYTAKLQLYGQVTGRFEVGPGNFMPPPHVDSAVVRIDRASACDPDDQHQLSDDELLTCANVIDAAFAQRRKTIRNSMSAKGFDKAALDAAFEACGIDARARAESLCRDDFVRLARELARVGAAGVASVRGGASHADGRRDGARG